MVLFLVIVLGISIVGLIGLISVRQWELQHGRLLMTGIRPKAGEVLGGGLHFVEAGLPVMVRRSARRAYAIGRSLTHRLVAWMMLHTERLLERWLRDLRGATQSKGDGEVSEFLREVAEHKRSLLKKSVTRAIYEE